VFVFGIPGLPESPALPPAEARAGPAVEVTPPAEGSLTLVVTLIAGPLPAGNAAAAEVPPAGGAAPAPPPDPAGGGPGAGAEEVAAATGEGGPRPGEGGIDVDRQLRGIDLYQPTPNPDRPTQISRRPDRDGVPIVPALAGNRPQIDPAAAAPLPEPESPESLAAPAVAADPAVRTPPRAAEVTDAVFALPPSQWGSDGSRLLASVLAGCAWYAWPDSLCNSARRATEGRAGRPASAIRKNRATN
jgi:hypothetical protein